MHCCRSLRAVVVARYGHYTNSSSSSTCFRPTSQWSTSLPWLPDGYSKIFRFCVFGPSGLKDYGSATLRCKIGSLPFLGSRPHALHPGAIQGKEGIKFCHLATLLPAHLGEVQVLQCYQMAKFDPFLSLDCARVEGVGAQSKERKGSNFAA